MKKKKTRNKSKNKVVHENKFLNCRSELGGKKKKKKIDD